MASKTIFNLNDCKNTVFKNEYRHGTQKKHHMVPKNNGYLKFLLWKGKK